MLYQTERPKALHHVLGQDKAVKNLQALLEKGLPHVILLSGPSGVGKTTLARILAVEMGCGREDCHEVNCADFKGIDTIREIRTQMRMAPLYGDAKFWIIDECFPGHTLVATPQGSSRIQDIKQGETVTGLLSTGTVKHIFENRVPLSHVVRVDFADGSFLITTQHHRVLTQQGWVEARSLTKDDCILSNCGHLLRNEMQLVRDSIPTEIPKQKTKDLLKELRPTTEEQAAGLRDQHEKVLRPLQKTICSEVQQPKNLLLPVLPSQKQNESEGDSRKDLQPRGPKENLNCTSRTLGDRQGNDTEKAGSRPHVCSESKPPLRNNCERTEDEEKKRNSTPLERGPWWQRTYNLCAKYVVSGIGRILGLGVSDKDQSPKKEPHIPDLLQSGFGTAQPEDSNRGRWEFPQIEKAYIAGCEKNPNARKLRVDRVEVFKRGHNEESFRSCIGDNEKSAGYVRFYDLEISGHPSYFADGVPVHNCHKLTNDAQTAILKLLEDPPRSVYFVLCTTDPGKLIKTIQTRCTAIKLDLLDDASVRKLVELTCAKHKMKVALAVIERIVACAEGSARKALVLLEQIWYMEDKEQLACIDKSAADQEMGILLARALIKPKPNWAEVAGILKQSKDEPESVRYLILGYARTVLLGGGPLARRAYTMIDCFSRNFYDSKQAGLAAACWEVVHSE